MNRTDTPNYQAPNTSLDNKNTSILLWNTEGLKNALTLAPENIIKNHDIVILNETFLTEDWSHEEYYCIHSFATQGNTGRPKGGISCLIKPNLSHFLIQMNTGNLLLVKTKLCPLISVYFQPEYKEGNIIDEISAALNIVQKSEPLILAGDLNCRIDQPDHKSITVIGFLQEEGLSLLNNKEEKTYIAHNGTSTIDLVFVNSAITPVYQEVLNVVARKHLPIKTNLFIKTDRSNVTHTRQ